MENTSLQKKSKSISIFGAFALSIGTSIGWGSFVLTGSSYLSKAGPVGSSIGLLIGMIFMLIIAYNYHYMMNKYPDSNGGIYTYAKKTLGGDHAYLVSWFLIITYVAILWANVTSFSLFARYIFGNAFQFGFHYSIGEYDIWLGEILLSTAFICLFGGICLLNKKITTNIQFGLAFIFIGLIIFGFIVSMVLHNGGIESFQPSFALNGENAFMQIFSVVSMTPWAFIGFESISHSTKNFKFKSKHIFKVFAASVAFATLIYVLIIILSISTFPDGYSNWYEYLTSSSSLQGLDAIAPFYVINRFLGVPGLVIFCIALFAIVSTSLIGNIYGISNLIQSMAEDGIFFKQLGKTNKWGNPHIAIIFTIIISFLMSFFGRVLIGWIVDINTICGIIVYIYICAISFFRARRDNNKKATIFGISGLVVGLIFLTIVLINGILGSGNIETESLIIFSSWAILGLAYYCFLLHRDKKGYLGNSMVALFGLLLLIIYSTGSWIANVSRNSSPDTVTISIFITIILLIATQAMFFYVFYTIKQREKASQDKMVLGMATMIEGRDNSTGGHIKRTSEVVRILVSEMRKDEQLGHDHSFYDNVIEAAPMHDLGKITIDDVILRKPGKFTPEEYEIMKTHASEGFRIVSDILEGINDESFKTIAANIAHYHHERWDGSGYPDHLKGEEIPFEARIMAIADVYDALVSKRVYKDAMTFETANKIILEGMGSQFDPSLEKYYLAAREKIEEFYKEHKDN